MTVFLDSSALVKLIRREAETDTLRGFLQGRPEVPRTASALSVVEVSRAVAPLGLADAARELLGRLHLVPLDRLLLDTASRLETVAPVRTLDAVQLACALRVGEVLSSLVTYDRRMAAAAAELGLPVASPA